MSKTFDLITRGAIVVLCALFVVWALRGDVSWMAAAGMIALAAFHFIVVNRSPLSREDEAFFDKVVALEKTDPSAAQAFIDAHYEEKGGPEEAERAQLRQRALLDPQAAKRLEGILREEVRDARRMLKTFVPTLPNHERDAARRSIEERERRAIAELEGITARLDRPDR